MTQRVSDLFELCFLYIVTMKMQCRVAVGGGGLTRVCKIEIIATNRPHRPWIPAYAGMTEWARLDSGLRRNDGMGPPGFRPTPE